jgi:hypothetical protein
MISSFAYAYDISALTASTARKLSGTGSRQRRDPVGPRLNAYQAISTVVRSEEAIWTMNTGGSVPLFHALTTVNRPICGCDSSTDEAVMVTL